MKFTHYDLGYLNGGENVIVTLKGTTPKQSPLKPSQSSQPTNPKPHDSVVW